MLTPGALGRFVRDPAPDRSSATTALRTLFAGMFLAQTAVAGLLAALLLLLGGTAGRSGSMLGPVLAALAPLQLMLGAILPGIVARDGSKGSSLAAALLAGVLLAIPAWFLVLALITGQGALSLLVIGFIVVTGYSLGFAITGRLAAKVSATEKEPFGADEPGGT